MTKVIVRCLLLDWNHLMSVRAMNFYFYLWLLQTFWPENTSSHIGLSRHNVGGTRPTHGSHGVVAPMIWTWVCRFLLDPCLSPSRSQENFLRIANLINNFYFYASDISLLSYPAKVFVRWSERKKHWFQPEKMTSYCTKIVFIITYRAAIGLRLLPAGPTAANLCFRTTLYQLTCRTSDHPTFWF